jgi:hypothetical protein
MRVISYFVAVISLTMLFGCGNEQDKIVLKYCKALEAGKVDDAVSYLSKSAKQELEKTGGKQTLAAAADLFKKRKGIKEIKISKREVTGEIAMIRFNYNFNDGSTSGDFFPLVKEDGKWKISK